MVISACRFACVVSAVSLAIVVGGPAHAQSSSVPSWLENLFSGGKSATTQPAPPAGGMPARAVLPPRRPSSLSAAEAAQATPTASPAASAQAQPIVTAAAPTAAIAAQSPQGPLTEEQIVAKANAYFNGMATLVGDFVQTGGDGRRLTGKLYLQRPGKIRFEYDSPATIEVIADGSSVAVRDRKLATQDLYAIAQTPLKFLLRERVNLGQDVKLTSVSSEPEGVRLAIEDKSTLGGTSKITLFFDEAVETLQRWRIVDPQGFTTIVALSNLDKGRRIDSQQFVINYERVLGERSSQ